jgi:hypothetical protein
VLDWLAKPENLQQTDNLPPFIESFDIGAYVSASLPIAGFVLGVNVLDEMAHRAVALQRKVCTFSCLPSVFLRIWQIIHTVRCDIHNEISPCCDDCQFRGCCG